MTQEEKELVLTDLCARLRYGVIIAYKEGKNDYHCWTLRTLNAPGISKSDTAPDSDGEIEYTEQAGIGTRTSIRPLHLEKMLPYLRHLSSMTDDEREEFRVVGGVMSYNLQNNSWAISAFTPEAYDWLNAHHFDFRGLIRMGLAIEAPDGMYNKEESENVSEIPIPKTVDEAVKTLAKIVSKEDRDYLLENGAISMHDSLGRWIRNEWGLWTGSELKDELMNMKKGLNHPDDMSNYIIEEFIEYLNKYGVA